MVEPELNKIDIERSLEGKGDFVKMDVLQRFLTKAKSLDPVRSFFF